MLNVGCTGDWVDFNGFGRIPQALNLHFLPVVFAFKPPCTLFKPNIGDCGENQPAKAYDKPANDCDNGVSIHKVVSFSVYLVREFGGL